jgi:hypothetical protein
MDPAQDEIAALTEALTGVWNVVRRGAESPPRFRRITFYRDLRFGVRSIDGRTTQWGSWRLRAFEGPASNATSNAGDQGRIARLGLRFDSQAGPSADYRIRFVDPPLGPMVWEDADSAGARVALVRAGAVDAVLVGAWSSVADDVPRDAYGLVALDLRADGHYLAQMGGGVTRQGTWEFERSTTSHPRLVDGVLSLDPTDTVFPAESWRVSVNDGSLLTMENLDAAGVSRFRRRAPDSWSRQLAGAWRFVAPVGAPVPVEITLRGDGGLEIASRPGAARAQGRWSFHSMRRHPNALEGTLALEIHAQGKPAVREQWRILLPHGRGAELRFYSADGKHSLRYRRLFR